MLTFTIELLLKRCRYSYNPNSTLIICLTAASIWEVQGKEVNYGMSFRNFYLTSKILVCLFQQSLCKMFNFVPTNQPEWRMFSLTRCYAAHIHVATFVKGIVENCNKSVSYINQLILPTVYNWCVLFTVVLYCRRHGSKFGFEDDVVVQTSPYLILRSFWFLYSSLVTFHVYLSFVRHEN
jgi:hypothetical protein